MSGGLGLAAERSSGGGRTKSSAVVLCAGLVTVDLIHEVDRVPGPNEKIVGRAQRLEVGGPAANAARTVAALGLGARLVAPYGRCAFTEFVANQLRAEGVEWIDPAAAQPNPSPISTVLIDSAGDRAVISGGAVRAADPPRRNFPGGVAQDAAGHPDGVPAGAAEADDVPVADGWAPHLAFAGVAAVVVDGHGGVLPDTVAGEARARGIPVVLDGGSHKAGVAAYLPHVDLALLSADFVPPGGADPLAWARAHGAGLAARSAGADPMILLDDRGHRTIPVPAATVIDTLGAGDVLHGATAAVLALRAPGLSGRPAGGDPQDASRIDRALRAGIAVASLSVEHPGALGWASDPATLARARGLTP